MALPRTLKKLLDLPTAAYLETAVMDYLKDVCGKMAGVTLKTDRYGNLLAHYRHNPPKRTPLAFAAHTDHPGFCALEMLDKRTLRAAFRGGVRPEYFDGSRVKFWVDGAWVKGRVLKLSKVEPSPVPTRPATPKEAHIQVAKAVPANALGMWDLPDAVLKDDRVIARGCDDLAGVAAMVTLLERLSKKKASAEAYCLFTRSEEVGFVGAMGAIKARTIPKRVPVLSIETSSALVNAPIGEGPIIRVGDRAVVYSSDLVGFCTRVATELSGRRKKFRYQRKLMDGGMCEAAAFGCNGYQAAGICLALGNYHNMNTKREKIDSEWVSLADWQGMVDLFEALVLDQHGPGGKDETPRVRIDKVFAEGEALLLASG